MAANSNVHAIGVLSQADRHLSLFLALRDELRIRKRRRRTRGGGEDEGDAEEEEGKEEDDSMVVVAVGIIPTRYHNLSWE